MWLDQTRGSLRRTEQRSHRPSKIWKTSSYPVVLRIPLCCPVKVTPLNPWVIGVWPHVIGVWPQNSVVGATYRGIQWLCFSDLEGEEIDVKRGLIFPHTHTHAHARTHMHTHTHTHTHTLKCVNTL